jgi:hypothetical protein
MQTNVSQCVCRLQEMGNLLLDIARLIFELMSSYPKVNNFTTLAVPDGAIYSQLHLQTAGLSTMLPYSTHTLSEHTWYILMSCTWPPI